MLAILDLFSPAMHVLCTVFLPLEGTFGTLPFFSICSSASFGFGYWMFIFMIVAWSAWMLNIAILKNTFRCEAKFKIPASIFPTPFFDTNTFCSINGGFQGRTVIVAVGFDIKKVLWSSTGFLERTQPLCMWRSQYFWSGSTARRHRHFFPSVLLHRPGSKSIWHWAIVVKNQRQSQERTQSTMIYPYRNQPYEQNL